MERLDTSKVTADVCLRIHQEEKRWIGDLGMCFRPRCRQVVLASTVLAAGRDSGNGPMDCSAGICLKKKIGDHVYAGETLAELHWNADEDKRAQAEGMLLAAHGLSARKGPPARLIHARVSEEGTDLWQPVDGRRGAGS